MPAARSTTKHSLAQVERTIPHCRRCTELRAYCAEVAERKKRAHADEQYWGRPVPGFGDHRAEILIVGLAPGAHGANRTGRMFTGDRSGDFLYAALHRAGLANQAESVERGDGLKLAGVYISAAIHCAPPANKPTKQQLANCAPYLAQEFQVLRPRVVLCLGAIAWNAGLSMLESCGVKLPKPKPRFAHAAEFDAGGVRIIGCYHVSQQNTFTGRLTQQMIDAVLRSAVRF